MHDQLLLSKDLWSRKILADALTAITLASLLLVTLGCGGTNRVTGDRVNTVNQVMTVSPLQATVSPGQTVQFTATFPWGGSATWSVVPATGGSFNASGLFTASATPGKYRIVANWNGDVRYTAMAQATVLPAPLPADSTPNVVSASGQQQSSATGQIQNAAVVGEFVPAKQAAGASGTVEIRHGFKPSAQ